MPRRGAFVAVLVIAIAGALAGGTLTGIADGGAAAGASDPVVHECAADMPPDLADPEDGNETIGWFDGYWYDEPLDINVSDGVTPAELDELSARTAARLEAMRCLTFEELPPVEVISRAEFEDESAEHFASVGNDERAFDNAQFRTLLLIGNDEDSVDVREASRAATTEGYYDYHENRITIVSNDPDRLLIDEAILAHELGHALQDQHFNLSRYAHQTKDLSNAKLGVIEGDVHRIEHQYFDRCEAERWAEPCLVEDPEDPVVDPPNWGLYHMQFQPYSDGPRFVDRAYDQGGWDAVNALYGQMPNTTHHVIYPARYPEFRPQQPSVGDRSSDEWTRIRPDDAPSYNEIGQAGMSAMFIGPAYDDGNPSDGPIVDGREFINPEANGGMNPFNYDLWMTNGWNGDRLYVYENDDATATLWKTAWADHYAKSDFLRSYERLIDYRGGYPVPGYEHTWLFRGTSGFEMAIMLYPDGDRLWIVTAPTVQELGQIHQGVDPIRTIDETNETDDADDANAPGNHDGPDPSNDADGDDFEFPDDAFADVDPPEPPGDADDSGPAPDDDQPTESAPLVGFGAALAVLALLSGATLVRRWRSRRR